MIAYTAGCTELKTAVTTWRALNGQELTTFNETLAKNNLKPIAAAASLPAVPICASTAGRGRSNAMR